MASQWRSVLLAASLEAVPPTSEAFQGWLRAKGGIVEVLRGEVHVGSANAGEISNSDRAASQADETLAKLVAGKFDLKKWVGEIAKAPPAERLNLAIDREAESRRLLGAGV